MDDILKPVRVYADIPQSLDIALKVMCARNGKTRKQYIAEIIEQELRAKGALAADRKSSTVHTLKG